MYIPLWHNCVPCPEGNEQIRVSLGDGFTAQEKDRLILVNGETICYEAASIGDFFRSPADYYPLKSAVNTRVASIGENGKTIVYKVKDGFHQTICKGDVQRRAAFILNVMRRLAKQPAAGK